MPNLDLFTCVESSHRDSLYGLNSWQALLKQINNDDNMSSSSSNNNNSSKHKHIISWFPKQEHRHKQIYIYIDIYIYTYVYTYIYK